MAENKKKQFGVWMDSHHATVVGRINVDNGDFVVLGHAKIENDGGHSNENAANNAERTHLHKFFKEITTHMQNAEELHITGTGTAQEQFKKYMEETPQFKHAIVKESTANKMSEEKLVEFFKGKFH
jgi:stalled ribosome rescue protein Dom34